MGVFDGGKGSSYLPPEAARTYSICLCCDLTSNILRIKDFFLVFFVAILFYVKCEF